MKEIRFILTIEDKVYSSALNVDDWVMILKQNYK